MSLNGGNTTTLSHIKYEVNTKKKLSEPIFQVDEFGEN